MLLQKRYVCIVLFQYDFSFSDSKPVCQIGQVDCQAFLKDLDLEKQVVQESG
jgi:hypothetical protein